ncbi:uncharacterized protein PB18E9.04c-like [Nannospalax galili]|uniref:uncharacterized protein PB18E9.04c-like n=1 Tax=Nannospalax galili TaxID=1026970 RepID=UPI00081A02CF|nr:uncharacterized protein PB18E9.04c-like [Nannospalax galili]
MTPWLGGNAGTVALADLAARLGADPALEAATCPLSLGALVRRIPPGAIRAIRAPPPPRPLAAASSSSKFSGCCPGCPPASLPCCLDCRARAVKCLQASRTGLETLPTSGLSVGPPEGDLSLGTFSLAPRLARACVCETVAPPASCSRLPTPPLPLAGLPPSLLPSTCTPPLGRCRQCISPFLPEAQLLTNIISCPPFLSPYGAGTRPFLSTHGCCKEEQVMAPPQTLRTRVSSELWLGSRVPTTLSSDPRRSPTPWVARCTSGSIAHGELTNRLAPSQQGSRRDPLRQGSEG